MLPNFESKIVSHLPTNKQHDGPTLFLLLKQCFQEAGLTKWKNFISSHCPDEDAKVFKSLVECQLHYLKALAGFPKIGDQLIHWFCTAQKRALMPMHAYMHC